jgi:hypothetical protein
MLSDDFIISFIVGYYKIGFYLVPVVSLLLIVQIFIKIRKKK